MKIRGFTLVELVIVIAITGVLAASVTMFLLPAIKGYFDARRRADMTDMADTALRRMSFDVRRAVPNSISVIAPQPADAFTACFRLAPTIAGGRYRMGPDTATVGSASASLGAGDTVFDALWIESQRALVAGGATPDIVVVDNTNDADVYAGANRAAITAAAAPALATDGAMRLTLANSPVAMPGYDQGRFVVVPGDEQVVYYSCVGGALLRATTAFGAASACGGGVPVATADAVACTFAYEAGPTATEQNGLLWMGLTLTQDGEAVTLSYSANVPNVP
ncbi:MAG TPA: type II secretion system protein [Rhodocyclaceae bacterium]